MVIIKQIVAFAIVLGVIVLIHELGHFLAARWMNIRVEVFSIGFGKRLFGWRRRETDFRVSMIPIGGYVRLGGDEGDQPEKREDDFLSKNRGQRILTYILGPVMNLFLALLLLTVIYKTGIETQSYKLEKPRIGYVDPVSPARQAGLQEDDLLVAINGKPVPTWKEVDLLIGINPKQTIRIDYIRGGVRSHADVHVAVSGQAELGWVGVYWKQKALVDIVVEKSPMEKAGLKQGDLVLAVDEIPIKSYFHLREIVSHSPGKKMNLHIERNHREVIIPYVPPRTKKGKGALDFYPQVDEVRIRYGLLAAVGKSLEESKRLISLTFWAFARMIQGKLSPENLSGPLEISRFSREALESGWNSFLMMIAFISLQLGLINLFPIPGLDGGQMMILTIESILQTDLNQKVKNILLYFGFSLLITLMIFVIVNDIAKTLPNGWKSLLPF